MNKENLLKVIKRLEQADDVDFNMSLYSRWSITHKCNTPGCIAGWTCFTLLPNDEFQNLPSKEIAQRATLLLDLENSDRLFEPHNEIADWWSYYKGSPEFVDRERAIRTLKHLYETGEVNWLVSLDRGA